VSAQAKSGFVSTYEQTSEDMYATFRESITQNLSDFQHTPNKINQEALRQIETDIADEFGTSREQVRKRIADYKQRHINIIETKTNQLKNNMLDEFAKEKKDDIHKEMTEDMEMF